MDFWEKHEVNKMLPKGIEKRNYKGQIKFCPILAPSVPSSVS